MKIDPLAVIGGILALLMIVVLWRLHHDRRTSFDLTDCLMENGKVSRQAMFEVGAFFATTWVLIHQEMTQVLSDTYVGAYGTFWIIRGLVRFFKTPNGTAPEISAHPQLPIAPKP